MPLAKDELGGGTEKDETKSKFVLQPLLYKWRIYSAEYYSGGNERTSKAKSY